MELSFGQRIDPENNLVECWFTHRALDEIKSMDLSDKVIIMFGSGLGNDWLAKRCKKLYVVERNKEWFNKTIDTSNENGINNIEYIYKPCNDCDGSEEYYLGILDEIKADIIINDDAYRFEVIEKALTLERPLILITDNWMQDFVFYCPKGEELLKEFEQKIFPQADHTNHEGNCWKTAIHYLK